MKRTWYYQATAAEGPFSQTEMEHLIANGIIDGFTNVRATTGGPWMPAKDTDAFHTAFHTAFHAAFDALPRQRRRKHKFSLRAFLYAICFIVNLLVVILLLNSLGQLANLSMMGLSHMLGGMPVPEYPEMVAAYLSGMEDSRNLRIGFEHFS